MYMVQRPPPAVCSRVPCQHTPPTVWSPAALAPGQGPSIRLCKTTFHPSSHVMSSLTYYIIESPANTMQIHSNPIGFHTSKDFGPHKPSITPTRNNHRSTGGYRS